MREGGREGGREAHQDKSFQIEGCGLEGEHEEPNHDQHHHGYLYQSLCVHGGGNECGKVCVTAYPHNDYANSVSKSITRR